MAFDAEPLSVLFKTYVSPFLWSWWTLALVFALANFKALPLVWTARTYYHLKAAFRRQRRGTVASPTKDDPARRVPIIKKSKPTDSIKQHPLFQPDIISTHVPLLEIDLNLHKSNSTFFTDLDISRIKLLGRLIAPAWPMDNVAIEYTGRDGSAKRERVKGRPALILGATQTSFKRELKAYASYNVESRVIGWDARWIYIGSWFVSKGNSKTKPKQIYATSISKYIVKKGRITVRPEQFLVESGWIPAQPGQGASANGKTAEKSGEAWSWDEVEAQRVKGMKTVDTWGDTDVRLEKEYLEGS